MSWECTYHTYVCIFGGTRIRWFATGIYDFLATAVWPLTGCYDG